MNANSYSHYKVKLTPKSYQFVEVNGLKTAHFITPDTKSKQQKLYVVKNGSDICYVGITSQSMSARFGIGFKSDGHYGYHGYKWRNELKEADILIWHFPDKTDEYVEAIEAELVYFIRKETRKWPKYQMEIHFHPGVTEEQSHIAQEIYKQCINN